MAGSYLLRRRQRCICCLTYRVSLYANSLSYIVSMEDVAIARAVKSPGKAYCVCLLGTTALATSVDVILAGERLIIMIFIKQLMTSRNIPRA